MNFTAADTVLPDKSFSITERSWISKGYSFNGL